MTSFVIVTVISLAASLCHVSAVPCGDVTAPANCSFENAEPCAKAYTSRDKHGLKWSSDTGQLNAPGIVTDRYNRRHKGQVTILSASPFNRYMHLRGTSDPRAWGMWTELISPAVKIYSGCLQYWYHNSVCENSSESKQTKLKVMLRSQDNGADNSDLMLRQYECVNDTKWRTDLVSLSDLKGNYKIVFSAQHHGWTNQLVAVDHVLYTHHSCSLRDDPSFESGDCDWEYGDMCGYRQSVSRPTDLRWEIAKQSHLTSRNRNLAKMFGSTKHGGVMTVSGTVFNTTTEGLISVSLQSPEINIDNKGCLVVDYYSGRHDTDNSDVTALVVTRSASGNDSSSTVLNQFPSTLGNDWLSQYISLPSGTYSLVFTARLLAPYGQQPHDFIAIDDVEIFQKPCDYIRCDPMFCSNAACGMHGQCIGQGLKHHTCVCSKNYIGKSCQFNVPYEQNRGFAYTGPYYG